MPVHHRLRISAFPMRTRTAHGLMVRREISQVPTRSFPCVMRSLTRSASTPRMSWAAHVAFDVGYRLGLCLFLAFAAQ